jgi:hypothetical protein
MGRLICLAPDVAAPLLHQAFVRRFRGLRRAFAARRWASWASALPIQRGQTFSTSRLPIELSKIGPPTNLHSTHQTLERGRPKPHATLPGRYSSRTRTPKVRANAIRGWDRHSPEKRRQVPEDLVAEDWAGDPEALRGLERELSGDAALCNQTFASERKAFTAGLALASRALLEAGDSGPGIRRCAGSSPI